MNTRQRPIAFMAAGAAAALLLVLVLSSLVACNGTAADVDPQTVLAASSAKMKIIKGFDFVYEVHKPASVEPSAGLDIARITGELNAEGSMRAAIDVTLGGVPMKLEFVAVAGIHYIRDPLSQKWQSTPAADSPVGTLSLAAGTIRILDNVTKASYEGEESKGGTTCHRIHGIVAAEEVKAVAAMVDTTNPFPTDIWIGVDDNLVYEVDIIGAATPNEHKDTWRSIVLSNLDTDVDIEAPE